MLAPAPSFLTRAFSFRLGLIVQNLFFSTRTTTKHVNQLVVVINIGAFLEVIVPARWSCADPLNALSPLAAGAISGLGRTPSRDQRPHLSAVEPRRLISTRAVSSCWREAKRTVNRVLVLHTLSC
jgi:hypothetical protein